MSRASDMCEKGAEYLAPGGTVKICEGELSTLGSVVDAGGQVVALIIIDNIVNEEAAFAEARQRGVDAFHQRPRNLFQRPPSDLSSGGVTAWIEGFAFERGEYDYRREKSFNPYCGITSRAAWREGWEQAGEKRGD